MRKRKKEKKKNDNTEKAFLNKRRQAVREASSKVASEQPQWMRNLSKKLWTKSHTAEREFNKKKLRQKELVAFKRGHLKPEDDRGKRVLQKGLEEFESSEKKRRHEYVLSIRKRA